MGEGLILNIAVIIGVVLISMTLHEVMHGFVAYWLGDDTAKLQGRLTLNPVRHIDPFLTILLPVMLAVVGGPIFGGAKPVPFNPGRVRYGEWGSALVALAGPMTNLFIAFIVFGVSVLLNINVLGYLYGGVSGTDLLGMFIAYGVVVNLGFFVFNMIPVPPLDGSRVLYALAPDFVRRGMELVEQYGLILVFMLVILASGVIGGFMYNAINAILQLFVQVFIV